MKRGYAMRIIKGGKINGTYITRTTIITSTTVGY